jgi:phosphatidate phosphatase APP1
LLADDAPEQARIVVFGGYGTSERVIVRGRVVLDPAEPADADANMVSNTLHNLDVLESDEVKFAPVLITLPDREIAGLTNIDGLFTIPIQLSPRPLPPGDHPFTVALGDKPGVKADDATGTLHVVDPGPGVALLSDFDDTIVNSNVANKPQLLWNTLTRNAAQLDPVPDANKAYLAAKDAGVGAFFYLSGSPLQLHDRIHGYLAREQFPAGVILLKNLGDDPLFAQLEYKIRRIETLLETVPNLRFILIGDTGEKDPEIYAAVRNKHPDRVLAIIIRRAPGADHGPPSRFEGMTVVDDYRGQHDVIAKLVKKAR